MCGKVEEHGVRTEQWVLHLEIEETTSSKRVEVSEAETAELAGGHKQVLDVVQMVVEHRQRHLQMSTLLNSSDLSKVEVESSLRLLVDLLVQERVEGNSFSSLLDSFF